MKKLNKIGIVCEYNPFHNGHKYHIDKIKELYPDSMIILIMSGCFTERGEISILNKWDKTRIALENNVDLVIEMPIFYSTNSADIFAYGAIKLMSYLEIDTIVFGSETNDIELFNKIVDVQLNDPSYDELVKDYMDEGNNYPTSMSRALYDITNVKIINPNDLLALSYIKQIRLQELNITPVSILRTNDYHNSDLNSNIVSASTIRDLLNNNQPINNYVPNGVSECLIKDFKDNYFKLLKYKLINEIDELDKYVDVSEGLDNRIKKFILKVNSLDELIENIKTKRYTYNRLNRVFIHIITNMKKENIDTLREINYIRVLGFNKIGKSYLKYLKELDCIPIITNYSQIDDSNLDYELRTTFIYNLITNQEYMNLVELKSIPIEKKD